MVDERTVQKLGYTHCGLLPEAFVKKFGVDHLRMSMRAWPYVSRSGKTVSIDMKETTVISETSAYEIVPQETAWHFRGVLVWC